MHSSDEYKAAEQLADKIIEFCIEKEITMREFQLLRTALPIAIEKKIAEQMEITKLC